MGRQMNKRRRFDALRHGITRVLPIFGLAPPGGAIVARKAIGQSGGRENGAAKRGTPMPEVYVYAVAGRTPEQKKNLMKDITDAVVKHFGAPPDAVVVQIVEAAKTDKSKAGVPFTER
jgi:4-oxalocrotonate tautomerase